MAIEKLEESPECGSHFITVDVNSDPIPPTKGGEETPDQPRKLSFSRETTDDGYSSSADSHSSTLTGSNTASDSDLATDSKNETDFEEVFLDIPALISDKVEIPESIRFLFNGIRVGIPDDYKVPVDQVPEWFDPVKYQLGRKFGQKYYYGITYAEMVSLYLLFLPSSALEPLIFTGNSHTPFKAFKRYLSTSSRVKTWIDTDVWNPETAGFKNLRTVRAMHLNVSKKMNSCPKAEVAELGNMSGPRGNEGVWCPLYEGVRKDAAGTCPFAEADLDEFKRIWGLERKTHVYVNQFDMSITQFGFVGLILLYPDKFGAGTASEEELEGFAHLWRNIGYLLGIQDEYNFCEGTLTQVRQRCKDTIEFLIKPRLADASPEWEHMSRCMVEGISYYVPGVSFEVTFSYLCWVLGVKVPSVVSSLSFFQTFLLHLTKFAFCHAYKFPGVIQINNYYLKSMIEKVQKQPKSWYDRIEKKKYAFQKESKNREKYVKHKDELLVVS